MFTDFAWSAWKKLWDDITSSHHRQKFPITEGLACDVIPILAGAKGIKADLLSM